MAPDEPINVSALNQFAYCPRRCALIYLEGEFENNVHTARGTAEHERVDRAAHVTTRDGARAEYALPVWSDRLGLVGGCDVVEFWPDGTIYPVEYKHGARRKWINDDLQLVSQAMCLEEMFGRPVPKGSIYHSTSRRRREIDVTDELKRAVSAATASIRAMFACGTLPPPVNDRRCRECSLIGICQPELTGDMRRLREQAKRLYAIDDE